MVRVAIVGSRNYPALIKVASYIVNNMHATTHLLISGGALGVDKCAANVARMHNIQVIEHLPDWDKYGNSAGAIRNKLIVNDSDEVIAFWDGYSSGTYITIEMAIKANKLKAIISPYGLELTNELH